MSKKRYAREALLLVALLIVLSLLYASTFGEGGILQLRRYRIEYERLRQENQQLQRANARQKERVERLQKDPRTLEHVARQRDYARPGDIVVELPPSKKK
ncbi:MAG: FtsB family cell division protein [Acidobacteriota bacterium]